MLRHLIGFCVRKRLPVLAITAAVAAYGVKAYLDLPVEAFPDVTNVQVQVIAQLPGLAPEEVERQLTVPIERALNGTPGMLQMRSESLFGLALVSLTFEDDADAFKSRALVTERSAGGRTAAWDRVEAGARRDAAGRGLPVPHGQRPPHRGGDALRARVDGVARAQAGAGRGGRRDVRRLLEGSARGGRSLEPAGARPDAGRRGRGAAQVEPERRRRLPDPRRPAADRARRGLRHGPRRHQGRRAQERGRHAGHDRRCLEGAALAHPAAGQCRLQPRRPGRGGLRPHAPRREPERRAAGHSRQGGGAEPRHPADRHAGQGVLRPHDAGRPHARHGEPQPALRRVAGGVGGVALPAQRPLFADRGVGHPDRAAHGVHRADDDSPAREPHLDGRGGLRHPGRRCRRPGRTHPAPGRRREARRQARDAAADRALGGRGRASDVLRHGHHRGSPHSGVHAAARGRAHLPSALAHVLLRARRRAGVGVDGGTRALRGVPAAEGRRREGTGAGNSHAGPLCGPGAVAPGPQGAGVCRRGGARGGHGRDCDAPGL